MAAKDVRIARQAREVARLNEDLHEALATVREARAKRDAALTRLEYLVSVDKSDA